MVRAAKVDKTLASLNESDFERKVKNAHPLQTIARALRRLAIEEEKAMQEGKKKEEPGHLKGAFHINREGSC